MSLLVYKLISSLFVVPELGRDTYLLEMSFNGLNYTDDLTDPTSFAYMNISSIIEGYVSAATIIQKLLQKHKFILICYIIHYMGDCIFSIADRLYAKAL